MSVTDITQIWNQRLQRVLSVEPADRKAAERAVERLYKAMERPAPQIAWHNGERTLPVVQQHVPVRHITDVLLYGLWFKIPEIERVRSMLGYNPRLDTFRLTSNKSLAFSYMKIKREGNSGYIRPQWARDCGNMICQFDAPYIAVFEYAGKLKLHMDQSLRAVGLAVWHLLESAFGAILFEDLCILIERPRQISLDGLGLLSSTNGPAFEMSFRELYAVNGVVLLDADFLAEKKISIGSLVTDRMSPQKRVALIEYMGWEEFLRQIITYAGRAERGWGARQARVDELDKSKWGTLYRVVCGNQEMMLVKVRNATKEKDGTYRHYVIPVDHMLRPLPNPRDPNGVMGAPQRFTALNAVASTFGKTGEIYKDVLGSES